MKYFILIWAGLWRKPMRTILTMLSITVAFLLFGVLQGMKTAVEQAIADARGDLLLVYSRVSTGDALPIAHLEQIKKVPGVELVLAADGFGATYQRPSQGLGVAAFTPDKRWETAYPNFKVPPEQLDAFINSRTGALVSIDLAKKYGWKIGDRIPLHSNTAQTNGSMDWVFEVVGIFSSDDGVDSSQGYIIINIDYFNEARQVGTGTAARFNVVVSDPKQAAAVADEIDQLFANSPHETRTESLQEMAQSQMQAIGNLDFVIRSIVGAVFVALLFATSTMMMQTIRDRTPELAVLKTVGFTNTSVFVLILAETTLMCIVAAVAGLLLASILLPFADKVVPGLSMPGIVVAIGLVSAVIVAFIVVIWPATRAARLEVVDALAGR